ncbi:hypothetical protein AJ79_01685 [Helicocarpus griseus UAMH5409]|uniref:Uncharacterized protein n=1 Tax=Helicocarpus griseus UAMH5409 TaxID=1447875 RepID=A0A2B7Y644_9EURO|nr:hypothetical protein AJ79_01685 [Helicocarpus griseus UAMH5409]
MGIAGLHGLLKSIQKPCNLRKFKGQTLGVDAYGWLHRGTVACAIDLGLDKHNTKYVDFAMNRVRMLIYFGVTPYLVFDGGNLPSKAGTEASRAQRREESKRLGLELYHAGRIAEAHQELQKAVDVTPHMARLLIEELKKMKIQYVVAPYEADAQLVYLEKQGIINGIISEDSDLLVFGAKRLLSKLDKHGDCIEISRSDFTACRDISLIGWTDAEFRQMCILSGCDYLANLPKMGLKTAYRNIRKYKTVEKILRMIQFEGNCRVPPQYLEDFKRAELTFLHQLVFCPTARKLVPLNPLTGDAQLKTMPFVGADVDADTAIGVACGDLDPTTKEPINLQPSYPERSRLVLSRRQTLASADLKPNKPINAFFTPKRVPLGELDPNSLTPSPSQQRLLEENARRSWAVSSAPTRGTVRTPSSSQAFRPRPDETPINRSSDRESFLASASTVSKFQPVKRQRLCSDAEEEAATVLGTEKRSRFFASAASKTSSTGADKSRTKKAKRADFGVFSDDVVEDIMSQLPNEVTSIEGRVEAGQTNTCEEDNVHEEMRSSITQSKAETETDQIQATESSTASAKDAELSVSQSERTAATGLTQAMMEVSAGVDGDSQLSTGLLEYDSVNAASGFHDRFAYMESKSLKEALLPRQEGKSEGVDHKRVKRRPSLGAMHHERNTPARMTPLQRLGQAALHRSKSTGCIKSKSLYSSEKPTKSEHATASRTRSRSRSRSGSGDRCLNRRDSRDKLGHNDILGEGKSNHSSEDPVQSRSEERCPSSLGQRGSEDLIIPDSEDDGEGGLLDEAGQEAKAVDFKRFLFTPGGG